MSEQDYFDSVYVDGFIDGLIFHNNHNDYELFRAKDTILTDILMTILDKNVFEVFDYYNIIKFMLDVKHINLNVEDKHGKMPLLSAIECRDLSIIKLFIEKGAKIDLLILSDCSNIIEYAKIYECSKEIIDYLEHEYIKGE